MTVVSLSHERQQRSIDWRGTVSCKSCGHEWHDSHPIGVCTDITCPKCGFNDGQTKHVFAAPDDGHILTCDCGSLFMTIYRAAHTFYIKCKHCGTDMTNAAIGKEP